MDDTLSRIIEGSDMHDIKVSELISFPISMALSTESRLLGGLNLQILHPQG